MWQKEGKTKFSKEKIAYEKAIFYNLTYILLCVTV